MSRVPYLRMCTQGLSYVLHQMIAEQGPGPKRAPVSVSGADNKGDYIRARRLPLSRTFDR